jgi:hypothetical protein
VPAQCQQANVTKQKRKPISYDDLPTGTKDAFKKAVIPLSLDATASLEPWELPSDKKILEIWNQVFDTSVHQIKKGDFLCDNFIVAKTLVSNMIFFIRHSNDTLLPR